MNSEKSEMEAIGNDIIKIIQLNIHPILLVFIAYEVKEFEANKKISRNISKHSPDTNEHNALSLYVYVVCKDIIHPSANTNIPAQMILWLQWSQTEFVWT